MSSFRGTVERVPQLRSSDQERASSTNPNRGLVVLCLVVLALAVLVGSLAARPPQLLRDIKHALPGESQLHFHHFLFVGHLGANAVATVLLGFQSRSSRSFLAALSVLVIIGVLVEVMQGLLTETRNPELSDVVLNLVGIGIGVALLARLGRLPDHDAHPPST